MSPLQRRAGMVALHREVARAQAVQSLLRHQSTMGRFRARGARAAATVAAAHDDVMTGVRRGDLAAAGSAMTSVPALDLLVLHPWAPAAVAALARTRMPLRRGRWHAGALEDDVLGPAAQAFLAEALAPEEVLDALVLAKGFEGTLGDVVDVVRELV